MIATDSNHDGLIFHNLAKGVVPIGPNQLWVCDITDLALPRRFAYIAPLMPVIAWICEPGWPSNVDGFLCAVGSRSGGIGSRRSTFRPLERQACLARDRAGGGALLQPIQLEPGAANLTH